MQDPQQAEACRQAGLGAGNSTKEAGSVSLRTEGLQALDEGLDRRFPSLFSVLKVWMSDSQVEPPTSSQMLQPHLP